MNPTETRTFEELECWKACRDLRLWVRREVIHNLPRSEQFLLRDQLVRATRSTTANIAEGHGRFHYTDNAKFCRNARGSCFEILDHLITAHEEAYITEAVLSEGREHVNRAVRLINGYTAWLVRASARPKD